MESIAAHGFEIVLVQPSLSPSLYTLASCIHTLSALLCHPCSRACRSNPNAMAHWTYHPILFVAVKKRLEGSEKDGRRVMAEEDGTTS
jgi:hypothetical protein